MTACSGAAQQQAQEPPPPLSKAEGATFLVIALCWIVLALFNERANDNHLEVSRRLMQWITTGDARLTSCRECFHPKLYHLLCAHLFLLFHVSQVPVQIVLAQLLGVASSLGTLAIVWRFLRREVQSVSDRAPLFAVIAFSPALSAIAIQATHDAFLTLLCAAAAFTFYRYLIEERTSLLGYSLLLLIAALLTKASALVLAVWIVLALILRLGFKMHQRRAATRAALEGLAFAVVLGTALASFRAPLAPYDFYLSRIDKTGVLSAWQYEPNPKPDWFKPTFLGYDGVTSIADAYFTFRAWGMLENPIISNREALWPFHRTSLWSQLYGRANFILFEQWPWQRVDQWVYWLGRLALLGAVVPMLLLVLGMGIETRNCLRRCLRRSPGALGAGSEKWVFAVLAVGTFVFIIKFTYDYRMFSAMKATYLLPGLLAFAACMSSGYDWAAERLAERGKSLLRAALWAEVACSLAGLALLFDTLWYPA